jgi:hypothetical protein
MSLGLDVCSAFRGAKALCEDLCGAPTFSAVLLGPLGPSALVRTRHALQKLPHTLITRGAVLGVVVFFE